MNKANAEKEKAIAEALKDISEDAIQAKEDETER